MVLAWCACDFRRPSPTAVFGPRLAGRLALAVHADVGPGGCRSGLVEPDGALSDCLGPVGRQMSLDQRPLRLHALQPLSIVEQLVPQAISCNL